MVADIYVTGREVWERVRKPRVLERACVEQKDKRKKIHHIDPQNQEFIPL